jgi:hypothetical protein
MFVANIERNPVGNWAVTESDILLYEPATGSVIMPAGKIFDSVIKIDDETNPSEIRRIITRAYDAFIIDILNAVHNSDCEQIATDFTNELQEFLEKYQCKLETDTAERFNLNVVIDGKIVPIAQHDGYGFSFIR